jgi:hypothetical protein
MFEPGKSSLFPALSSSIIETLVPSLSQCSETRNTEVFWLLSQPLPHLVGHHLWLTRQTLPTVNRKHFFMNILCIESFCSQKRTTERCSSVVYLQARSPFWLLIPASEHAHVRLPSRLSCSWTVLLPSDIHRKPAATITAVLLPSVTYSLTLPRSMKN